jgi:hypothetical protein
MKVLEKEGLVILTWLLIYMNFDAGCLQSFGEHEPFVFERIESSEEKMSFLSLLNKKI